MHAFRLGVYSSNMCLGCVYIQFPSQSVVILVPFSLPPCVCFFLDDLEQDAQAATSPSRLPRWSEEHRRTCTIYSALPASFVQDSSPPVMSFTWWMTRSLFAKQTMRQLRLEVWHKKLFACDTMCENAKPLGSVYVGLLNLLKRECYFLP